MNALTTQNSGTAPDSRPADTGTPQSLLDTSVLTRSAEHLAQRYAGHFSPETVERYVFESYTTLSRTARVQTHLTSLATHFADTRLRALALAEGKIASSVPRCSSRASRTRDARRSPPRCSPPWAGRGGGPLGRVTACLGHPPSRAGRARRARDRLENAFPKPLTDDVVRASDYVITMGCGDACPIYPGKHYLGWELEDPAEADLDGVRAITAEIDGRVQELWDAMRA